MVVTGDGELGFDSREGASETATTSKEADSDPIVLAFGIGVMINRDSRGQSYFIVRERKLGARRRSDTVLVSTINDAGHGSADAAFRTPSAPYEKSKSLGSGGSMVTRLKLKGIDGLETYRIIANVSLQQGIPSKRESSARVDYVPALCTHRPSLLPIEWFGELFGPRRRGRFATHDVVRSPLPLSFRGRRSCNKVFVGEPAKGSL
ncbi:hypothetical protein V6N13_081694 [Hibiscus sabdariffa]